YSVEQSETGADVLTAKAGSETDGDLRTVFTLSVDKDGSWDFDLQDQLDHAGPQNPGVENTGLESGLDGTTTVPSIDFSSILTATDADGDIVTGAAPGSFAITVVDDIPTNNFGDTAGTSGTASAYGISGTWNASAGADEPISFGNISLSTVTVNSKASTGQVTSQETLEDGTILVKGSYQYNANGVQGDADDQITFSLQINSDNTYSLSTDIPTSSKTTFDTVSDVFKPGNPSQVKSVEITDTLTGSKIGLTLDSMSNADKVYVSNQGVGVNNNLFEVGETIKINPSNTYANGTPAVTSSVSLLFTGTGANQFTEVDAISYTIYGFKSNGTATATPISGTITTTLAAGPLSSFTFTPSGDMASIDYVVISAGATTNVKLDIAFETSSTVAVPPVPVTLAFNVPVTDADGDTVVDQFTVAITPGDAVNPPIAVDVNNDGTIEYQSLAQSQASFDFDSNGIAERTAWVGAEDGLLAFDHDGNNIISDASEIAFARLTPENDTDLQALATIHDTNKDGLLDANDESFSSFGVWQDDGDGVGQLGEFHSLQDLGISSINLIGDGVSYTTADGDVLVHGTTTVTYEDGTTTIAQDVELSALVDQVIADPSILTTSTDVTETITADPSAVTDTHTITDDTDMGTVVDAYLATEPVSESTVAEINHEVTTTTDPIETTLADSSTFDTSTTDTAVHDVVDTTHTDTSHTDRFDTSHSDSSTDSHVI
uniref:hypothetical protein n=1 Tax=Vulcanococcus limneticus TaxID=2170428 RepID=UPI00398BEF07